MSQEAKQPVPPVALPVPGAQLVRDFITAEEEAALLHFVNHQKWATHHGREVQQYGFAYQYDAKNDSPPQTTPLPKEFAFLIDRLVQRGLMPKGIDQCIVNRYRPGQGIAAHIDHVKHFGDTVCSVSCSAATVMTFAKKDRESHDVYLPPCSALSISGPARYEWTHSIARRRADVVGKRSMLRGTRVSFTFRTMKKTTAGTSSSSSTSSSSASSPSTTTQSSVSNAGKRGQPGQRGQKRKADHDVSEATPVKIAKTVTTDMTEVAPEQNKPSQT